MDAARRHREPPDAGARLRSLGDLAEQLGATAVARDAAETAARVAEGRFYVACVGQFKRGKSTLLNALVGEPVLPTGVVPVTSAITVLRHGERGARVRFQDGRTVDVGVEALPAYVTERENPENRKGVRAVEVFLPAPLLARGMCLVDTPGLGSASGGNAAVTREFVPHLDAALVVVGADPPVSGEEVAVAEDVAAHARHLLVVLNKADRVTDEERHEGARFAVQLLSSRLRRPIGRVFEVSAHERAASGVATRDWAELASTLDALAHASGADLVEAAEARAVERLGRALRAEISGRRDALLRPVADSERRVAALDRQVAAAERAMADLGALLSAEQARLTRTFRARQEAFLQPARGEARRRLAERVPLDSPAGRTRQAAFDAARGLSTALVERFRSELEPEAEQLYGAAMERFVALANEFLQRVAGEPGMDALPRALGPEAGFRARGRLHYTHLMDRTSRTPIVGWFADLLRTRRGVARIAVRDAGTYLDALVESNSSRVANDLVERTAASRARLEAEIRARLREVSERAGRALSHARERIDEGQEAVERELARLQSLRTNIESLVAARTRGEEA
ncbi:MAG TPA: dynamin family protein [Anaeromyxobacteraceae bacterium]|nr:dynamin family protein [Anaeromyxobacteraceae bacterium]